MSEFLLFTDKYLNQDKQELKNENGLNESTVK